MDILLNFIPVGIHILMFPMWYLENKYQFWSTGTISFYEIILNTLILPIFLLVINIIYVNKEKCNFWFSALIMLFVVLISAGIHYLNWGITSQKIFDPDAMTVGIILWLEVIIPLIIITTAWIVFGIIGWNRNR